MREIPGIGTASLGSMVARSQELFGLLNTKHNTTTNGLGNEVSDRNGLEMYQFMFREYGPHAEGTGMALLDQAKSTGKHTCKTFEETHAAYNDFKKLFDEYNKVTDGIFLKERLWAL